jgi:hypothetical protein
MNCEICKKTFSSMSILKRHMAVHFVNDQTCAVCGLTFNRRDSMMRHYRRNHPAATTPAIVRNQPNMVVKTSQPNTYIAIHGMECEICNKSFSSVDHQIRHMTAVHMGKKLECMECDVSFTRRENMLRHYTKKHPTSTLPASNRKQTNKVLETPQNTTEITPPQPKRSKYEVKSAFNRMMLMHEWENSGIDPLAVLNSLNNEIKSMLCSLLPIKWYMVLNVSFRREGIIHTCGFRNKIVISVHDEEVPAQYESVVGEILQHIATFETNGSCWVVECVGTLELHTVKYSPFG